MSARPLPRVALHADPGRPPLRWRLWRRLPLTFTLVAAILVVNALGGWLGRPLPRLELDRWGLGFADLVAGRLGGLLTTPFLVLRPAMALSTIAIVLLFVGGCELLLRTRRTAAVFLAGHVGAYLGAYGLLALLARLGVGEAGTLLAQRDVGASNGAFAAAGAAVVWLPAGVRRPVATLLGLYLAGALLVSHRIWDLGHALAFATGIGLGLWLWRREGRAFDGLVGRPVITRRQRPQILAALVATMGIVDVLASFLLPHHAGFARLVDWLPLGGPHLPRHLLLLGGLSLTIVAAGLGRAQRTAWWIAFVAVLLSLGLHLQLELSAVGALLAVGLLVMLVAWRGDLRAPTHRPGLRDAGRWLRNLALGLPAAGAAGVFVLRGQFAPLPPWRLVADDLARRLLFLPPRHLVARDHPASWLLAALPLVWWGGLLACLVQLLRGVRPRSASPDEREQARRIMRAHGSASTAFMTLWPGNALFFTPGGAAYVAYRVHAQVAVALGDPVGPAGAAARAVAAFDAHCAALGWTPVFYAVGDRLRDAYAAAGLQRLKVGEEAVLPLAGLEFKGREWQNMRTALNRAQRQGLAFHLYEGGTLPATIAAQLLAIDAEWQRGKGLPPLGFTLGTTDDLRDPAVDVAVALDADGRVQAFADWLPVPATGGWVIDLMRRRADAMGGIMEYLIGMSLLAFRQRGDRYASLATAPLADLDRAAEASLPGIVMQALFENFETFYDFRSLFDFKERFRPRWEPVYLAYRDPATLPAAAVAVLRAHLPDLDAAGVARLLGASLADRLPLLRPARPA
ncbi:MAG: bifunctional lysylphosphatidylglycerol flippase/synthetase MprF [Candidatus Krumholzibacteriia bacterium]